MAGVSSLLFRWLEGMEMTKYLGHQFGDYHLVRLLGTGGFAEVYGAEHLHLPGTKAAMKILKDTFTKKQLEELRNVLRRRAMRCIAGR
jgi:serine/threonine protein kinase